MTNFGADGICRFDYGNHQFYEYHYKDVNDPYSGEQGKDLNYCKKCGVKKND